MKYPQEILDQFKKIRIAGMPGDIFFTEPVLTCSLCHPCAKIAGLALPPEDTVIVKLKTNAKPYGCYTQSDVDSGHSVVELCEKDIIDTTECEIYTFEEYAKLKKPPGIISAYKATDPEYLMKRENYFRCLENPNLDDSELGKSFLRLIQGVEKDYADLDKLAACACDDNVCNAEFPKDLLRFQQNPTLMVTDRDNFKATLLKFRDYKNPLGWIMMNFQRGLLRKQRDQDNLDLENVL